MIKYCGFGVAYGGNDGGDKATPSAEDSSKTNHKLGGSKNDSDDICRVHPASNFVVGIESLLHIVREDLLTGRFVELPDVDRVEPEVGFAGGAVCDCFLVVLVLVALAVVPETDCVEVFQLSTLGGVLKSVQKVVVDIDVVEGL